MSERRRDTGCGGDGLAREPTALRSSFMAVCPAISGRGPSGRSGGLPLPGRGRAPEDGPADAGSLSQPPQCGGCNWLTRAYGGVRQRRHLASALRIAGVAAPLTMSITPSEPYDIARRAPVTPSGLAYRPCQPRRGRLVSM